MKEFLSQQGTEYTELDIAQDENALKELESLGVFTTPVTVIDGVVVVGFDKPELERLLGEGDE